MLSLDTVFEVKTRTQRVTFRISRDRGNFLKTLPCAGKKNHFIFFCWLQYGREQYLDKVSAPLWISTDVMIADIFTKPFDKTAFLKFRAVLLNYKNA